MLALHIYPNSYQTTAQGTSEKGEFVGDQALEALIDASHFAAARLTDTRF